MADSKLKRGKRDRERIALGEAYEVTTSSEARPLPRSSLKDHQAGARQS